VRFLDLLDSLPILGIFLAFAFLALLMYEIGFRLGRWWQARTPDEVEGPTGTLVGSLFALMAFLLAITMGMASDRFDTRRGLVLEEANSIGTTFLRAGYLPEPAASESQELIREYVPLRIISTSDMADLQSRIAAGVYARVPETVLVMLMVGSALTLGMVGYAAGLTRRRSPLTAIVLIAVLGAVITLVVDLDRPRDGFLTVSQQPLIDLQQQIGPPLQ
jgi:hypothetical protein